MASKQIKAGEVTVGMQLAAADGYLFTVLAIVRSTAKTVTLKLGSDFSPIREIRAGVEKTFRKSSVLIACVPNEVEPWQTLTRDSTDEEWAAAYPQA